MPETTRLFHLASLAGIEPGYWDISGTWHGLLPDTVRALLAAMGLAAETAAGVEQSIDDLEKRPWRRTLPPVIVNEERTSISLTFHVPEYWARRSIEWIISLEGGETVSGILDGHGATAEAHNDTLGLVRYRLDLMADLPCGYHTLRLDLPHAAPVSLIVAPPACFLPSEAAGGQRRWGIAAHLYSLRGSPDAGIGDFSDLQRLTDLAGHTGAATVGLNPLHALFLSSPQDASPYAPSSRLFLNPLYLEVDAPPQPMSLMVEYEEVARLKRRIFEEAFQTASPTDDFQRFCYERGGALENFATFEALSDHFASHLWTKWPAEFQDWRSAAVADFRARHRPQVDFHAYLQWRCHQQMTAAAAHAEKHLPLGLYGDLALSVSAYGADAWMNRELYTSAVELGAPADDFNPKGQTWGVAAPRPRAQYDEAYATFIAVLRANMRYVRILRLDHVMGLERLFWVPAGGSARDGAYVRYPVDDLLRLVALESQRQRCVIIGEDLGTVTPELRQRLERKQILSYRVLYFEKNDSGFKPPEDYPALAMACLTTHDLPTLKGYWQGIDLILKRTLHLFADEDLAARAEAMRAADLKQLIAALEAACLMPQGAAGQGLSPAVATAIHRFVARTKAWLCMVQIDDLAGEEDQLNLPGTAFEHANWRRRLSVDLDTLFSDPAVQNLLAAVAAERAAVTPHSSPGPA